MFVKRTYKKNRTYSKKSLQSQQNQYLTSKNSRKWNRKIGDSKHDQESMGDFSELAVPDVIDYNLNGMIIGIPRMSLAREFKL